MQTLGDLLEGEGYNLFYASSKNNQVLRLLDMLWACYRYRNQVNIVLIDTYSTLNFYYALTVGQCCRFLKLPYAPILHGGNLETRLKKNPGLSKKLFTPAKLLISPSWFMKEVFERYGYSKVTYIPNSIKIEEYPFDYRSIDQVKLLWVRSFSEIYNPTLAVKILKQLLDENIAAELCMVGPDSDGSLAKTREMAESMGLNVLFKGKLSKAQWHDLSKDYSVFINTTNFDNMPVSVIEAMALGLPIISTNVGGMPYLIDHEKEGLLVPPNDSSAFVFAIKKLSNQPVSTKSMVFNARAKVEQFDWEIVKQKWFEAIGVSED